MNNPLSDTQLLQVEAETSRRLHDRLAECESDLRELEAEPTRYTVADYNQRFQAITRLREQTRTEIERLQG